MKADYLIMSKKIGMGNTISGRSNTFSGIPAIAALNILFLIIFPPHFAGFAAACCQTVTGIFRCGSLHFPKLILYTYREHVIMVAY